MFKARSIQTVFRPTTARFVGFNSRRFLATTAVKNVAQESSWAQTDLILKLFVKKSPTLISWSVALSVLLAWPAAIVFISNTAHGVPKQPVEDY
ncbi:hypothetical protein G210_0936 [Candida maltosa Xu316]|uniref:Uncharacterized protein n=1 Tax=Candida maltosa (strain Xu316) TaxID=1245528 RepID=M3HM10_CANMX|nr:hypothetical protein G210_0936 [Candida maltosa Xu316]